MEWQVLYARLEGCKTFKAFDIHKGCFVGNVIYATQLQATEANKRRLQDVADDNKGIELVFQLRQGTKVVFQTI